MPDYVALHTEVSKPAYGGMTDSQIASALNLSTIIVHADLGVGEIEGYLRLNARVSALEDWIAANPAPSAARTCAREMLGLISGKVLVLKTSDQTIRGVLQAMFAGLVSSGAGGITQADSDALFAMATRQTSWAAQNGWQAVGPGDVAIAKGL